MDWNLELEPFQMGFVSSKARFPGFVSAWGTGKTMCGIMKGVLLSKQHPGNLGLILRKNFTDLKDSTMADFARYTAGSDLRIKVQDKSVAFSNGSKILFHHADELAGVVQNINLGWFFIEQAEEFDNEEVFTKLRGRLRRENCQRQGFIIANTNGHNWIWRMWKADPKNEFDLYEAKTHDNAAHLPDDFIKDLEDMAEQSPSHYRRFVLNSWEDTDTADKVIPYDKLLEAVDRDIRDYAHDQIIVSCDPAEFGNDKCVIYVFKGLRVIDEKVTTKRGLMETAGNIVSKVREHNADVIVIDDIGVGAGVRSRLNELLEENLHGAEVMSLNTGNKALDPVRYVRLRDQVWMHAAEQFKDDYVSIPNDNLLIEELGAFTYSMNSKGQIQIARKKDIKKIIGHSPDMADALVMGLWAARKAKQRERLCIGASESSSNYDPLSWGL